MIGLLGMLIIVKSFEVLPKEVELEIILTPSPTPTLVLQEKKLVLIDPEPIIIPEEIVIVEDPEPITLIEEIPFTPAQVTVSYEQGALKQMICDTFGPYCQDALIIAQHESGYNVQAISPTDDHGLFQINAYWQRDKYNSLEELYDPATNIAIAWQIFTGRGNSWSAWYTCKYLPSCY